eukprot:CAMPEP_0173387722 /NCGR_PEP_ID=MMETSP1356-20130122/10179_1 /TAXON_ID=77927 ORGANISM="Hemiselmis virescens, Strain PCC157" /NCGR_SAMPLE_ID=MMETSP1356 /ASSEMBLY_ACC=CAM_ASM_000847 /LENGTH=97 /DNA_ID=CAMNT_0014344421 /DNA_START=78 /DNA_END=368 /DNA_ORIENTATION=+
MSEVPTEEELGPLTESAPVDTAPEAAEASAIPADDKLKEKLRTLLAEANLEEMSKRAVRRKLEENCELKEGDLDGRKKEIGDWVDEYIKEQDDKEEE